MTARSTLPGDVGLVLVDLQYASACRETGLGRWLDEQGRAAEGEYRFDRIERLVVPNARRLLDAFRAQQRPVVHVRLGAQALGARDLAPSLREIEDAIGNLAGEREFEFLDEVAPVSGEPIVTKVSASAFSSSGLEAVLRNLGLKQLVIAGVSTAHCVDLTARDAADRGFDVTIVADACAEDDARLHNDALHSFGRLYGQVRSTDEVLSPVKIEFPRNGSAGAWSQPGTVGPLAGLRVIDAGTMIAGPYGATLLADYGASVIKIEKPGDGDAMRHWAPIHEGRSLWWKVNARNKRLITLNFSQPEGQALFKRLAADADVVIENFRPGTFARWNLGYEELARENPGLILVHVSGFGQTGPYSSRPGYGTVAEAFSGIPSFTGYADKPPTFPAFPLADTMAGCFAALGALSALEERRSSGRGQEIDVALYEPLLRIVESSVIAFDQLGHVKQRRGNRLEEDAPRNTYETSDGRYIALSASSPRTFERLADALGRPELATDPRFLTNQSRIDHVEALDAIIGTWVLERTGAEVMAIFEEYDVVAGAVYDVRDLLEDPHVIAREIIASVPDLDFGTLRMPGIVPRFSRSEVSLRGAGGAMGADNADVFRELLGLSEQTLEELTTKGVV